MVSKLLTTWEKITKRFLEDIGSDSFCPKAFKWYCTKEYTNVCIKTCVLLGEEFQMLKEPGKLEVRIEWKENIY